MIERLTRWGEITLALVLLALVALLAGLWAQLEAWWEEAEL